MKDPQEQYFSQCVNCGNMTSEDSLSRIRFGETLFCSDCLKDIEKTHEEIEELIAPLIALKRRKLAKELELRAELVTLEIARKEFLKWLFASTETRKAFDDLTMSELLNIYSFLNDFYINNPKIKSI